MLNQATEKTSNCDIFTALIMQEIQELRSPFSYMRRCGRSGRVRNQFNEKPNKITSNKRVFSLEAGNLIPFGIVLECFWMQTKFFIVCQSLSNNVFHNWSIIAVIIVTFGFAWLRLDRTFFHQ